MHHLKTPLQKGLIALRPSVYLYKLFLRPKSARKQLLEAALVTPCSSLGHTLYSLDGARSAARAVGDCYCNGGFPRRALGCGKASSHATRALARGICVPSKRRRGGDGGAQRGEGRKARYVAAERERRAPAATGSMLPFKGQYAIQSVRRGA